MAIVESEREKRIQADKQRKLNRSGKLFGLLKYVLRMVHATGKNMFDFLIDSFSVPALLSIGGALYFFHRIGAAVLIKKLIAKIAYSTVGALMVAMRDRLRARIPDWLYDFMEIVAGACRKLPRLKLHFQMSSDSTLPMVPPTEGEGSPPPVPAAVQPSPREVRNRSLIQSNQTISPIREESPSVVPIMNSRGSIVPIMDSRGMGECHRSQCEMRCNCRDDQGLVDRFLPGVGSGNLGLKRKAEITCEPVSTDAKDETIYEICSDIVKSCIESVYEMQGNGAANDTNDTYNTGALAKETDSSERAASPQRLRDLCEEWSKKQVPDKPEGSMIEEVTTEFQRPANQGDGPFLMNITTDVDADLNEMLGNENVDPNPMLIDPEEVDPDHINAGPIHEVIAHQDEMNAEENDLAYIDFLRFCLQYDIETYHRVRNGNSRVPHYQAPSFGLILEPWNHSEVMVNNAHHTPPWELPFEVSAAGRMRFNEDTPHARLCECCGHTMEGNVPFWVCNTCLTYPICSDCWPDHALACMAMASVRTRVLPAVLQPVQSDNEAPAQPDNDANSQAEWEIALLAEVASLERNGTFVVVSRDSPAVSLNSLSLIDQLSRHRQLQRELRGDMHETPDVIIDTGAGHSVIPPDRTRPPQILDHEDAAPFDPDEDLLYLMLGTGIKAESPTLSESVVNALLPSGDETVGLSDNGASKDAGCCKTKKGALPGSFRSDVKSVKVGDENGALNSDGTYQYLVKRIYADGAEFILRKQRHTPTLRVPWVTSEASESDEHGYDIIKRTGEARTYEKNGKTYTLSMSSSGLGWFRIRPVTCCVEMARVLAAMRRLGSTSIDASVIETSVMSLQTVPKATSMGTQPQLKGVALLRRQHIIDGHVGLDRTLRNLEASGQLNKVTKQDIETFKSEGCGVCESTKMRRNMLSLPPVDSTPPPPGKKWVCDALELRVPDAGKGFRYIYRCVDKGSALKVMYGLLAHTASDVEEAINKLRAKVKPKHGDIFVLKLDSHPAQKSKQLGSYLASGQPVHGVFAPGGVHEGVGEAEVTFMHDVPAAMALLTAAPDLGEGHVFSAMLTVQLGSNHSISGNHSPPSTAWMRFSGEEKRVQPLVHVYGSACKVLVHPEKRESKYDLHALPSVYTGPAHHSDSPSHCSVWDGRIYKDVEYGLLAIDESVVISRTLRTHPSHQPFNQQQITTAHAVGDMLDLSSDDRTETVPPRFKGQPWIPGEPDPFLPFIIGVCGGHGREGDVMTWVHHHSNGKLLYINVDIRYGGLGNDITDAQVREALIALAGVELCTGVFSQTDCSAWSALKFNQPGPPPLFDTDHPDGITKDESLPTETELALDLVALNVRLARTVMKHGGFYLLERPAKQSSGYFANKELPKHSTITDTSAMQELIAEHSLVDVHFEQCMHGALSRKPTSLLCSSSVVQPIRKAIGTKLCNHDGHEGDTVGFDASGKSKSKSTQAYPPVLCGRLASAMVEAHNVSVGDLTHASGPPATTDLWPVDSRVEVYWFLDQTWYAGTVIGSRVKRELVAGVSTPVREIWVRYDADHKQLWHALHNNQVRAESEPTGGPSIELQMLIDGRASLLSSLGADAPSTYEHWHGEAFLSRGLNFDISDWEEVDPVVMHVVTQTEVLTLAIDPDVSRAHTWHEPRNEREYLRSPQHALWRTAKELKMDKYMALNLWELVPESSVDKSKYTIYDTLWAHKIKFDSNRKLDRLNPRWCVKGTGMDRDLYKSYSEMMRMSTFQMIIGVGGMYYILLCRFTLDVNDAFQATRTDKPGEAPQPPLYCRQAPGFEERGDGTTYPKGTRLVCKVNAGLQGRIDATRLFDERIVRLFRSVGFVPSLWDKKLFTYENLPKSDHDLTLTEKLELASTLPDSGPQQPPVGWATFGQHVDDGIGVATGLSDPKTNRIVQYLLGGIQVEYACKYTGWKQCVGFELICNDSEQTVTLTASNLLASTAEKALAGMPTHAPKHVMSETIFGLKNIDPPAVDDPARTEIQTKQSLCRSILGASIYLGHAYPQMMTPTNIMCGSMHSPDPDEMLKHIRHMFMHMLAAPHGKRFGGKHLTKGLEQPKDLVHPFTAGLKAGYFHYASDGSLQMKSITGGVGMLAGAAIIAIMSRQHLASPCAHSMEVVAAGTNLHIIIPINGILQEWGVRCGDPTPFYLDSVTTTFVIASDAAAKRSVWTLRRVRCLQDGARLGEIEPIHIEESDMIADPFTKYLPYAPWARHRHYYLNLHGDPPNAHTSAAQVKRTKRIAFTD